MGLQTSGAISMGDVAVELGLSATTNLTLDDSRVRKLAGKETAGSAIGMGDLLGKSNLSFTFDVKSTSYEDYASDVEYQGSYETCAIIPSDGSYVSGFVPLGYQLRKKTWNATTKKYDTTDGDMVESVNWTSKVYNGKTEYRFENSWISFSVVSSVGTLKYDCDDNTEAQGRIFARLTLSNGVVANAWLPFLYAISNTY